eukprot:6312070-Prymnesium_polylepis.1
MRDGCMSAHLRWGAGRMMHPPGRHAFSCTSISYIAVVSACHAQPTLSCTTVSEQRLGRRSDG